MKNARSCNGVSGIKYPGEIEATTKRLNRNKKLKIEAKTWDKIKSIAAKYIPAESKRFFDKSHLF